MTTFQDVTLTIYFRITQKLRNFQNFTKFRDNYEIARYSKCTNKSALILSYPKLAEIALQKCPKSLDQLRMILLELDGDLIIGDNTLNELLRMIKLETTTGLIRYHLFLLITVRVGFQSFRRSGVYDKIVQVRIERFE